MRMVALFSPQLRRNTAGLLVRWLRVAACAMGGQVRMGPVAKMLKPQPDLCGAAALIDVVGQPFTLLADHQLAAPCGCCGLGKKSPMRWCRTG